MWLTLIENTPRWQTGYIYNVHPPGGPCALPLALAMPLAFLLASKRLTR